ncbi:Fidgetin-like protein 1 [Colletotrichum trifolii]|uniref:Fidgetin-like protein 1 n=1 Tax=Colletotrichum trifolii TaxID=5466 RepID=A0A4R8RWA7_COLTR|nr:Fidgetin-like protein 1 [Colletotrichum trifolii]
MGISDKFDKETISDTAWKWRCKVFPNKDTVGRSLKHIEGSLSEDDRKKGLSKEVTFGVDATVKTLYEGKNSTGGIYDWVDYPPKQLSKKAAQNQDRPAIKIYKIKDLDKPVNGGRFSLEYHSIVIQNAALVVALEPILKKEDVYLEPTEAATFAAPFRPLYFCYDDIISLYKHGEDSPLEAYLQLLVRTLDDMLSETRERTRRLQASGLINFKLAWAFFPKDTVLYSHTGNAEMVCKVEDTAYVSTKCGTVLAINCKVLSFNGEAFVWVDKTLAIRGFKDNKPIGDLDHFPLTFHPDSTVIRQRLLARGKRVLDLQGLTYCTYNGIAIEGEKKHNVEGRILIDVVGFNKYALTQGKREGSDPQSVKNRATWIRDFEEVDEMNGQTTEPPRPKADGKDHRHLSEKRRLENKEEMLARPDDLIFLSPIIEGFALKNKLWLGFYIEDIEPIAWNDKAYEHLVYDEQQKDLVLSFVENHGLGKRHEMEDVIVGKGQGLIILLSGPPGTGKTLTAEAVADKTKRPLFYLQAEDLGINPASLGANIKRVFAMAVEWDAVILLDEADVFMAERNPVDIARNELVSIFLRELEYFRGIIFLTTNLYHTIDTAFRSRVSLHLLFKPLTADARLLIWQKFLGLLPESQSAFVEGVQMQMQSGAQLLSIAEIKELSQWQLNGREIKNAVKMVKTWCDHKSYDMNLARLENGIRVTSPHASKQGHAQDDDDLYD